MSAKIFWQELTLVNQHVWIAVLRVSAMLRHFAIVNFNDVCIRFWWHCKHQTKCSSPHCWLSYSLPLKTLSRPKPWSVLARPDSSKSCWRWFRLTLLNFWNFLSCLAYSSEKNSHVFNHLVRFLGRMWILGLIPVHLFLRRSCKNPHQVVSWVYGCRCKDQQVGMEEGLELRFLAFLFRLALLL